MQKDRNTISGKRKVAEAEAPSVGTSTRGKKSKTSKNQETGKPSGARETDDSKWPDCFKEVSVFSRLLLWT